MKLFLGVSIPNKVVQEVAQKLEPVMMSYPEFSWMPTVNYHITVFFFGERSEKKVPDLIEGLEQIMFDVEPDTISLFGLKMFVRKGINIHISYENCRALKIIHDRIEDALGPGLISGQRRFIPHTTVAKYKLPSKQQYLHLKKKLEKISFDDAFVGDEIHLFESIEKKPFPEYRIIHTFHLQKS